MKKMLAKYKVFLSMGITCLLMLSCNKKECIQIGFLGDLTGKGADLGIAGRNGAMLAVEMKNMAGGIKGQSVQLLTYDTSSSIDVTVKSVRELIDRGISAIIGPMTSSMAMATVPIVNNSSTIMVSPTVTTTELTGKDDNFLRVISDTSSYATKSARYHYERCGHRKIAAIYDISNKSYTESWLGEFNKTFTGMGGTIIKSVAFRSEQGTVFNHMVRELLASQPDAIIIITNAVDAAMICQQIRKLNSTVEISLSEWSSTERFIELAGTAANGAIVSQFLNRNDSSESYRSFLNEYRKRFAQEPGFPGLAGYDAASVAMEGLERSQSGKSLKETLLEIGQFKGVQQTIRIDRFGDSARESYISVVKNGKFVTLE